jgi:hypothetical protein
MEFKYGGITGAMDVIARSIRPKQSEQMHHINLNISETFRLLHPDIGSRDSQ